MFQVPPNFFGGFDFFSVVSNNRQNEASPRTGRNSRPRPAGRSGRSGRVAHFSVVSNNRQHVASRSEIGRLVGGSALKPGLPPAGADGRFSGRISAGSCLENARLGRPQTRRRKLLGPPPYDSLTRPRDPAFRISARRLPKAQASRAIEISENAPSRLGFFSGKKKLFGGGS